MTCLAPCFDLNLALLDFFFCQFRCLQGPSHSGVLQVHNCHNLVIKLEGRERMQALMHPLPGRACSQHTVSIATGGTFGTLAQLSRLCQGKSRCAGGTGKRPKAGRLTQYLKVRRRALAPFGTQLLAQAGLMVAAQCLEVIQETISQCWSQ